MLDSSRREVLVSAVINTVPDFATGAAVAIVARLTGIEALEEDDGDESESDENDGGESEGGESKSGENEFEEVESDE